VYTSFLVFYLRGLLGTVGEISLPPQPFPKDQKALLVDDLGFHAFGALKMRSPVLPRITAIGRRFLEAEQKELRTAVLGTLDPDHPDATKARQFDLLCFCNALPCGCSPSDSCCFSLSQFGVNFCRSGSLDGGTSSKATLQNLRAAPSELSLSSTLSACSRLLSPFSLDHHETPGTSPPSKATKSINSRAKCPLPTLPRH